MNLRTLIKHRRNKRRGRQNSLNFMDYTDEQIVKMYENLPDDLRTAIFSVDTGKVVENIGRKYNLTIDKMGDLGNETGMVMLGVTHPKDFISNLAERLEVDKVKAKEIAEDVNVQIFRKVRESLKAIHNIRDEKPPPKAAPLVDTREEILKEIEKKEEIPKPMMKPVIKPSDNIPEILKGSTSPTEEKPPVAKTEQKYQRGADPYRERTD